MDILKQKIKFNPDDFVVEEVFNPQLSSKGIYSYYILKKKNRNTLDVLSEISAKLNIPLYKFGFSGLKDKRATTVQYISIEMGPKTNLKGKGWELTFVGKASKGIEIGEAQGNTFTITIRNIDPYLMAYNLEKIVSIGMENYFGEQRFLSDLNTKKPIALYLVKGDFEGALREYFTQSNNPFLRKRLKRLWGKWDLFLEEAKHLSHQERRVILALKRTKDPQKAFMAFPKNLKLMFLFSYQSLLWNRILSRIVESSAPYVKACFIKREKLCFYKEKNKAISKLAQQNIPFVSREALEDGHAPFIKELKHIVRDEGIENLLDAHITNLRFFNPGTRSAIVFPQNLEILYQDRNSLTVRFFLPSGSYATILIRKALVI